MHPLLVASRAAQSREIGARLVRVRNERIFLDELDPEETGASIRDLILSAVRSVRNGNFSLQNEQRSGTPIVTKPLTSTETLVDCRHPM